MTLSLNADAAEIDKQIHNYSVETIDGDSVELSKYDGKVLLIVNVASKCGLTPQYEGLQDLYDKYKDKGLVILGFPCNQFGKQEPGTNKEIQEFCSSKYKVTFDLFDKVDVNGPEADPLFKALTTIDSQPLKNGEVKWNFEKFLVSRKGELINRFSSRTTPDDKELVKAIEKAIDE